MAFRTEGTNHAGIRWALAPALVTLAGQVTDAWPGRDTDTDGTVASKNHDAGNPGSDHSPDRSRSPAVVRAIDITEDEPAGASMDDLGEELRTRGDRRLLYWIHHGRMFSSYPTSSYPAWAWRPYNGFNQHKTHGHLSVISSGAEYDPSPWEIGEGTMQLTTHQFVGQLTADDITAICNTKTISGRWVINPGSGNRDAAVKYYRDRRGNPADPAWIDFHVAVLAAGQVNATHPAGIGDVGVLRLELAGTARP